MNISINDPFDTLNQQQVAALQVKAAAYPFDIHVMIATNLANKPLFEHTVADMVTGPKMLAIGIDPQHHFTYVRGSADLGLPSGPEVASAGNHYFRKGDLVTGIDSIAARANDLRVSAKLVSSQAGEPIVVHEHHTASVVWWLLGTTMAIAAVTLVYVWRRNRKRERELMEQTAAAAEEAAELRGRNLEEGVWHDRMKEKTGNGYRLTPERKTITATAPARAPYQAPAPSYTPAPAPVQPIVVNNQAPNNSALDMLIGYELGQSSNRPYVAPAPVVVERETVIERDRGGSGSNWTSDDSSSSSSSSWDSSSSSSSSSDWGGGGSDSGGGGGSDW